MSTLRDMVKDEMVKTSSSIASNENRQFLSSLTVPQVRDCLVHIFLTGEREAKESSQVRLNIADWDCNLKQR